MKVGIISGTFDPVHAGHLAMAHLALNDLGLNEVWFLPERSPRNKQNVTGYIHRLNMLQLATSHDNSIKITETEHSAHSLDTLRELKNNNEFYILVGADVVVNNWHQIDEIKKLARIVTFGRNGEDADLQFDHPASSKTIREQIANNRQPDNLNQKVLDYIYEHNLYQS